MRSRPKIPRTPINEELLTIIKKENESLLASATHVHKNDPSNRGKKSNPPQEKTHFQEDLKADHPVPPQSQPQPQSISQPPQATDAQPVAKNIAAPLNDGKPDRPDPTPEPHPEVKPLPAPDSKLDPKPDTKAEAKTNAKVEETKKANGDPLTQTQEFSYAFGARSKIARTPPGQQKPTPHPAESPYAKYYKDPEVTRKKKH
jgi:hypothetical protein